MREELMGSTIEADVRIAFATGFLFALIWDALCKVTAARRGSTK